MNWSQSFFLTQVSEQHNEYRNSIKKDQDMLMINILNFNSRFQKDHLIFMVYFFLSKLEIFIKPCRVAPDKNSNSLLK